MEKRKPKIISKKLRGEWAEMVFMTHATEFGLEVSRPWGDSRSYDFVVGRPGHFVAVQVKSTIQEISEELEKGYSCSVRRGRTTYRRGSFDFLAAYVIYENAWYIIPEELILGMQWISLATNCEKSRYEGYREAWQLLDPNRDSREDNIEIQACVEEFAADWTG
ncbi:MAG: group I intron-associated PD-(D/E)XK endonuclease [Candidatus Sulfotelmatobacter sp.]|jgi:hypothetical protein